MIIIPIQFYQWEGRWGGGGGGGGGGGEENYCTVKSSLPNIQFLASPPFSRTNILGCQG